MLFLGLTIVAVFMIAHLYSSVSLRVSRNSNIGFAIISEKPCFVIYHSLSRIVNVINIPEQLLNLKGTDYQKTVAIYRFVSKNLIIPYNSLLYVSIKDKFLTENKFLEVFNFEGSNVKQTIKAFKYIWKLKRTDATNFSWNDAIVSYLEIIGLNPSNFIITQFAGNLNIDKLNLHMSDYNPFLTAEDAIIKVEILNASGVKSRAAKITKYLREKGVDVVNFGNFPSIRKKSKIVNCSDSVRSAFKVRDILDLRKLEIYSRYDSSNMADAIVIIGADFNEDNIPELKR